MEQVLYNMLVCTLVILVTLLFSWLFRRRYSVTWRYYIWLLVMFRLLLPYDVSLPFAYGMKGALTYTVEAVPDNITRVLEQDGTDRAVGEKPLEEDEIRGKYVVNGDTNRISYIPEIHSQNTSGGLLLFLQENLIGIVLVTWFVVAVFLVVKQWGLYILSLHRIKKCRIREDSEEILQWIREISTKLHIRRPVRCYRCSRIRTPMAVGIFRCMIILPEEKPEWPDMKYILCHELVHIKHYHTFTKMLAGFVQALYWFNPVVFYMRCLLDEDMEILCDGYVVKELSDTERTHYNYILLRYASEEGNLRYASGLSRQTGTLKRRLVENMWANRKKRGVCCGVLIAVMLVVSLTGVSFKTGSQAAVFRSATDNYIEEFLSQDLKRDTSIFNQEVDTCVVVESEGGQLTAYGFSADAEILLMAERYKDIWVTKVLSAGEQLRKCFPALAEPDVVADCRLICGQNHSIYLSAALYRGGEVFENEFFWLDTESGYLVRAGIPDAGMDDRGSGKNRMSFQVFADGNLLIQDGTDWYVYNKQKGVRICDLNADVLTSHLCAGDDRIYGIHMDQGGTVSIVVFDEHTGREQGMIRTGVGQETIAESGFAALSYQRDSIYLVCHEGVWRAGREESEAIRLINGDGPGTLMMSDDRNWAQGLMAQEDGSYIISYQKMDQYYPLQEFLVRYTQAGKQ